MCQNDFHERTLERQAVPNAKGKWCVFGGGASSLSRSAEIPASRVQSIAWRRLVSRACAQRMGYRISSPHG
jgi:hypothetical protein